MNECYVTILNTGFLRFMFLKVALKILISYESISSECVWVNLLFGLDSFCSTFFFFSEYDLFSGEMQIGNT